MTRQRIPAKYDLWMPVKIMQFKKMDAEENAASIFSDMTSDPEGGEG